MTGLAPSSAVWLRGTSQLRRRWRSWLGLALLVGLAGGFLVASVAGARRTTTAYDRLLETARPFDVVLGVGCAEELEEDECAKFAATSIDEILALPPVADGALIMNFLVPMLTDDGFSIQPQDEVLGGSNEPPGQVCFTGSGEVDVLGSPSGRFGTDLNRDRFVAGRAADPTSIDEAVMSVAAAQRADVHVGDSLRIVPVDACDDERPPEEWPEPFEVTVVGLHVTPGEVQPETGRYFQSVTVTPPLLAKLASALGPNPSAAVLLRDGTTTADLMAAVEAADIRAEVVLSQDEFTVAVRRGLRPDALTLWLLAALGGAASVIVLGQALSRQAWAGAEELPALRAIGFTSHDLAVVGAVEGAAVALVAGFVTTALAVAASPLFPIGRARVAEPNPGLRVDVLVVGLGALIVAVASFVIVVVVARRVAVRTVTAPRPPDRPALVTVLLGHLGARPPAVVGARMALERGHGARAVPVRTGFIGIAVGVAALVGSLTFGADLEHLLNTPRLVGWNWDVGFLGDIEPPPSDAEVDPVTHAENVVRQARAVEGVERVSYATFFPPNELPIIEALPDLWPLSFSTGPGSIGPTVTSGRAPAGPDEMLVTRTVLTQLGLQVGDPLEVQGARSDESGETVPTTSTVTIVGTGVLPIGDGAFEHSVALTFDGLQELAPGAEPQFVVADLAADADRRRTTAALQEIGLADPIDSERINVPALVDLDVSRADDLPRLLGALMAALAIGVLVHLVYSGVRAGRHDLATLRALGFTRTQVASAIAWATTAAIAVPFAVAAVVGSLAGRAVWLVYAERLAVAPETVLTWWPIAGFLIFFLVLANILGLIVGRGARKSTPADVLRTE